MASNFIGLCALVLIIYLYYFKSIKAYNQVITRGYALRIIRCVEKEKNTYLKALRDVKLSENERRDLNYILGLWYARKKEYKNAVFYLEEAFQHFKDDFKYKKEFILVIDSYINASCKDQARKRLEFFLSRKSFDKNFRKLEKMIEKCEN